MKIKILKNSVQVLLFSVVIISTALFSSHHK